MNNLPKGVIIFVVAEIILLIQGIVSFILCYNRLSFNPYLFTPCSFTPLSFINWVVMIVMITGLIKLKNWARILTLTLCFLKLTATLFLFALILFSTKASQMALSKFSNDPISLTIGIVLAIYGGIYFTRKSVEDIFLKKSN